MLTPMRVVVRDLSGRPIELDVVLEETVADVKRKYCSAGGCEPIELGVLVLTRDNTPLDQRQTLACAGVTPGCELRAVLSSFPPEPITLKPEFDGRSRNCCWFSGGRELGTRERQAKSQRAEAAKAAAALGLSSNEVAFGHALNQHTAASLDSRSAKQLAASTNRSVAFDTDEIERWCTAAVAAQDGGGDARACVRPCVSCATPMGLGLRTETILRPCGHRGLCVTCAEALGKLSRQSPSKMSEQKRERRRKMLICQFCNSTFQGFVAVNHVAEHASAPESKRDEVARAAGEAGVSLVQWEAMDAAEREAARERARESFHDEANKQGAKKNTAKRATFLQAKAGLQARATHGSIELDRVAGPADVLRAMLLLDVLPRALWSSTASTTVTVCDGEAQSATLSDGLLDRGQGHVMTLLMAIADEAAFGDETPDVQLPRDGSPISLIDYEPRLVFALGASLGRWRDEKGYALCQFLGTPLVDRTQSGIIDVGLNVCSLFPIPPFDPCFATPLSDLMAQRASELLATAKERCVRLVVLWSGGIDSTAVVVAFLSVMRDAPAERRRLHVRFAPRSVAENPRFYHEVLVPAAAADGGDGGDGGDSPAGAITLEQIEGHVRDAFDQGSEPMVVSGDPADMLFCTFKIAAAFTSLTLSNERMGEIVNPMWMNLEEAWQRVLPAALHARGLLLNPDDADDHTNYVACAHEWCEWIAPHVALAPIPIVTTFDFFWWVTYSCKYQFDMLRVLRNRETAAEIRNVYASFFPFFAHASFDQWSFHNHTNKMGSYKVWASYKMPLKRYIAEYFVDHEYFASKTKLSSAKMGCGRQLAITADFEPIAFGKHSLSLTRMEQKYGAAGLDRLLTPAARARKEARVREQLAATEGAAEKLILAEQARRVDAATVAAMHPVMAGG